MVLLFDIEYEKDFDGNIISAKYHGKEFKISKEKIEKKGSWIDMVTDGLRVQRNKLETQMDMYNSAIKRKFRD